MVFFFKLTFTLLSQIHNYCFHFLIVYSAYSIFLLLDLERYFCKANKPLIQHWHGATPLNLGNDQVCFTPHQT